MKNIQAETPRRTITEWIRSISNDNQKAGWWDGVDVNDPKEQTVKIALIHSELSEALEGVRCDTMDKHLPHRKSVEVELADAVIRIFDMAGAMSLDLEAAIHEKCAYNLHRNDHKPEVRAAAGGKRF
jgi:NTP pyrophosphatase (non-canonical NTP hydrolase)